MDVVETEGKTTFINKLLVEMKNTFNNPDRLKMDNHTDSDESLSSRECSSSSSVDNIQDEDLNKSSVIEVQEGDAISNEVSGESSNCISDYKETVDDALTNQDDEDEKNTSADTATTTFRKPNQCSKQKPLRAKVQILDEIITVKRSPRRRSRDYNESILQSAIARKEKSYNEGNRPQRLTRLLKPTPKILENLANAAALKYERNRKDKTKTTSDSLDGSDSASESDNEERKTKRARYRYRKIFKHGKHKILKDADYDSNQEAGEDDKLNTNSSQTEEGQRRSTRLSSRSKDEYITLDDCRELPEASIPEQDSCSPADPESSSMEAQLTASQLCLCTEKTQFYASNDSDIVFCSALDSISDKVIGCSAVVDSNEVSLLRPSTHVPYIILCKVHYNRIVRHNCCPKCGLFCTEGKFAQCEANHQYHRECQVSSGQTGCCPHCGLPTPNYDVLISMDSQRKPIFLPLQKAHYPSAKMSFSNGKLETPSVLNLPLIPAKILNLDVKRENCVKYTIQELYDNLKVGNIEKIAEMLGSIDGSLSVPLPDLEGATLLHYAAQHGMLSAVHLLVVAGAEVNLLDKEQNTALVNAILGFENNVVNYLIKAGSSITLKGTDGMTPLHIAAKLGNVGACELLLDSSTDLKNYINVTDDGGWTSLVWACEHGHIEVAKFLVNRGADVSLRDVEQNTALHWGAFSGCEEIAELLLNNKSDVNAVNVHEETPLHISARQDMYNYILVLLSRGAQVDLVNKAGETALDCCRTLSDCYTAVSLNVNLHTARSSKRCTTIIANDISRGRETNPIQGVNKLDYEQLPNDYTYIVRNCVTTDDVHIDQRISAMHHCKCDTKCISFECVCCNSSLQCWYNKEGKLVANFNYSDPPMIFECNQLCSCNAITCINRVVQHGVTQRFQVFKTELKGWGTRTLRGITKGTFVCEYVGEIISDVEAEKRDDDSYMFDLDNKELDSFCIDAKHYGNFARFINHGCEPNLVPIRIFIDYHDLHFPRIALFANRNINPNEELSFDYGDKFWLVKYKSFTCYCGSSACKYSESSIAKTIEKYNIKLEEMAT